MKPTLERIVKVARQAMNVALKPRYFWLGALALALGASAIAGALSPPRQAAVLWFPDAREADPTEARSELRYIGARKGVAEQAAELVEELLLGPMDAKARPIAVPQVRVESAIVSNRTIYLDISADLFFGKPAGDGIYASPPVEPRVALEYIDRALRWNFRFYDVRLTVEGLEPEWESVIEAETALNA